MFCIFYFTHRIKKKPTADLDQDPHYFFLYPIWILPSPPPDLTHPGYPAWFRGLRLLLTTAAVLSLLATLFCIFTLGVRRHASDYLEDLSTTTT